jgi:putative hydrolase of HD superfamily
MLSTLIELQRLKRLDRTGWTLRGLPNGTESVAAHSFGVCVTAMLLTDHCKARGVAIDVEKVLRIALLHDWAETRVGDMPRTATLYFGSAARKQAETAAFADIVNPIDADGSYAALYNDYERRESLEARAVVQNGRRERGAGGRSKERQTPLDETHARRRRHDDALPPFRIGPSGN